MARTKRKAATVTAPQNLDEANAAVARIGELTRELERREVEQKEAMARIRSEIAAAMKPAKQEVGELIEGLNIWAEANRVALTRDGRTKTVKLPAGLIRWRIAPPRVRLSGIPKIIETLKERYLSTYLRIKTEVDKEAILKNPDKIMDIPGITVISGEEEFIVEPFGPELKDSVTEAA